MDAQVRSFLRGQVSDDEVRALLAGINHDHNARYALEGLARDPSSFDILVADADLRVAGDLILLEERAFLLTVNGSLLVDGLYRDYDSPESYVLVSGDMRARDVITTGYLEIGGSLATGTLIGDYNDCTARIGGDVHARVFYGGDHHFTIGGRLIADAVLMLDPYLTDIAVKPPMIRDDDPRMLGYLDQELLEEGEDDDGNPAFVGIDRAALIKRVAAGIPLRSGTAPRTG